MKYLFYLGHPAHFHLFKNPIKILQSHGHTIIIVIKKKDVLENLLKDANLEYYNIYPKHRKDSKLFIALSLIRRNIELFKIANREKPKLMIGTSAEITHVGKLLSIPSLVVNEDDADQVPLFVNMSYPFASHVITPINCRIGKWGNKAVQYNGYHEIAYLHKRYFIPDENIIADLKKNGKSYFILRFAELNAHHDSGRKGINDKLAAEVINLLERHGNVYITSERKFHPVYEKYRINLEPSKMHHALAFADMYIGDSQSMAAEAALLGTPSVRFNDFVGKLTYLNELESSYGLTYGVPTTEPEMLITRIKQILSEPDIKNIWRKRSEKLYSDKIDVTLFLVWLIENYPRSVKYYDEYAAKHFELAARDLTPYC